jgi:hypothetical protein
MEERDSIVAALLSVIIWLERQKLESLASSDANQQIKVNQTKQSNKILTDRSLQDLDTFSKCFK